MAIPVSRLNQFLKDMGSNKVLTPGYTEPAPKMPRRKWYEFLPGFRQVYEDKLARWQTDYDRWSLEDQRKYDSPKSEMQRFGDANLSPALAYTQESGGQQPSQAKKPDDVGYIKMLDGLGSIMDLNMKAAQIRNVEADTQKKLYEGKISTDEWIALSGDFASLEGAGIKNMSVAMKREYERVRRMAADADTAEKQAEVADLILKFYSFNQITRFIGPLLGQGMGILGK